VLYLKICKEPKCNKTVARNYCPEYCKEHAKKNCLRVCYMCERDSFQVVNEKKGDIYGES